MYIGREGDFYKVWSITGPRHNCVQIALAQKDEQQRRIVIEKLAAVGKSEHGSLDEALICREVLEGVAEANRLLGTDYRVSTIQYFEDDTPRTGIYRHLAFKLIEHLETNKDE